MSLGQIVADAWEQTLRETPDPFRDSSFLWMMWSRPRPSYRAELDRQRTNSYGEIIPRIVTVRRNVMRLGKPVVTPKLPM